jgi:sulfur carrier protein ThiS
MIKHLIKYGTKFSAVEYADDGQFFFLQLKRKQKELTIASKGEMSDFESLLKELQGQKHLFLIVNNEQVLTKKVANNHTSEERLVKSAFPNIALSDFYYRVHTNAQEAFVSISRKEYIDEVIERFSTQKISVIDFSLGSLSLQTITNLIDQGEIATSNAVLKVEEQAITAIEKQAVSETKYTINELEISNKHLLSLAGIVTYYSGGDSSDSTQKQLQLTYVQKRFFDLGFKFVLGFLFVSLLINFLVFSSYQRKESLYTNELQINEAKKKELTSLKDLVSRKKKLVESISSSADSRVVWYFNEISASVPSTISLKNMSYQPVEGSIKEDKKIRFKEQTIEVSGESIYDKDFTKWISSLEQKEWIEEVSYVNYGRGKKTKTSFDFIITLNE